MPSRKRRYRFLIRLWTKFPTSPVYSCHSYNRRLTGVSLKNGGYRRFDLGGKSPQTVFSLSNQSNSARARGQTQVFAEVIHNLPLSAASSGAPRLHRRPCLRPTLLKNRFTFQYPKNCSREAADRQCPSWKFVGRSVPPSQLALWYQRRSICSRKQPAILVPCCSASAAIIQSRPPPCIAPIHNINSRTDFFALALSDQYHDFLAGPQLFSGFS